MGGADKKWHATTYWFWKSKEKIMLEKIRSVIKNILCKILCIKQCMCKKKK